MNNHQCKQHINCSNGHHVNDIHAASEWNILNDVVELLRNGNALDTSISEPIVEFKFPEELKKLVDFKIPEYGVNDPTKIREICEDIIKYSLKTSHPQFRNQLFGAIDPYGLAGSWITEALNTSSYTFEVAPVFTLMENELLRTFCKMFGFENGDGIFAPGGSMSNMYGMVLARYRAVPNIKSTGCFGLKPLVAFTSADSHYSIRKASHWLGIGVDNVVAVKTDEFGSMSIVDLIVCIERVLSENRQPFFVNATAGTTVLGAFDNFNKIADVCSQYRLWMHVDGCLGGSVVFSQKHRHLINGIHRADSIAWNPHKSLGVPLQCSMFLIKENGLLHQCNSSAATYLFQQDKFYDVSYDTGDKSVQCGRKVDVFKFWLMLKARGLNSFEHLIDNAIDKANYMVEAMSRRDGFRLVQENVDFTNVCFWYVPINLRGQAETVEWWMELYRYVTQMKAKMVLNGSMMIGYTPLPSRNIGNFFRMTLSCFPPATKESIDHILDDIITVAESI